MIPRRNSPVLESRLNIPVRERVAEIRATFPFNKRERGIFERAAERLPYDKIESLFEKYSSAIPGTHPKGELKYLDVGFWLWSKAKWVAQLDLDNARPARILDLGCGAHHFGFICESYGHSVVGLDVDVPVYIDLCEAFGVDRRTFRIDRRAYLPRLQGKFDLVVAFDICFNLEDGTNYLWSLDDWIGMFRAVDEILNPEAKLLLHLNVFQSGRAVDHDELFRVLTAAGAICLQNHRNRLVIPRKSLVAVLSGSRPRML